MRDFEAARVSLLLLSTTIAGCAPGDLVNDRPTSYLAQRYEATVPQKKEFTCGAASLATIFTFYWKTPTTEATLLDTLRDRYTEKQISDISETGLSFDDLIFMAQKRGFAAEGAKIQLDQLPKLAGPVIVHLETGSLKHFVVLRKVGDGVYYISDPVVGERTMHADEFASQYTGNALAVWKAGMDLPKHAQLVTPHDGIRLSDSLRSQINAPIAPFNPGF